MKKLTIFLLLSTTLSTTAFATPPNGGGAASSTSVVSGATPPAPPPAEPYPNYGPKMGGGESSTIPVAMPKEQKAAARGFGAVIGQLNQGAGASAPLPGGETKGAADDGDGVTFNPSAVLKSVRGKKNAASTSSSGEPKGGTPPPRPNMMSLLGGIGKGNDMLSRIRQKEADEDRKLEGLDDNAKLALARGDGRVTIRCEQTQKKAELLDWSLYEGDELADLKKAQEVIGKIVWLADTLKPKKTPEQLEEKKAGLSAQLATAEKEFGVYKRQDDELRGQILAPAISELKEAILADPEYVKRYGTQDKRAEDKQRHLAEIETQIQEIDNRLQQPDLSPAVSKSLEEQKGYLQGNAKRMEAEPEPVDAFIAKVMEHETTALSQQNSPVREVQTFTPPASGAKVLEAFGKIANASTKLNQKRTVVGLLRGQISVLEGEILQISNPLIQKKMAIERILKEVSSVDSTDKMVQQAGIEIRQAIPDLSPALLNKLEKPGEQSDTTELYMTVAPHIALFESYLRDLEEEQGLVFGGGAGGGGATGAGGASSQQVALLQARIAELEGHIESLKNAQLIQPNGAGEELKGKLLRQQLSNMLPVGAAGGGGASSQQVEELEQQVQGLKDFAKKARTDVQQAQQERDAARGEVQVAQQERDAARGEVQVAQQERDAARGEVQVAQQERDAARVEVQQARDDAGGQALRVVQHTQTIAMVQQERDDARVEVQQAQQQTQVAAQQVQAVQQNLNQVIARHEALEAARNSGAGLQEQIAAFRRSGVNFVGAVTANTDSSVDALSKNDKALFFLQTMDGVSQDAQTKLTTNGAEMLSESTSMISQVIDSRMDFATGGGGALTGVAAGDSRYFNINNMWATGFYGISKQGDSGKVAGYNGKTMGGSVGIDFQLNEDLLFGVAYSRANSNFAGNKKGKTLATSNVFSLYSKMDFTDKISLSMLVSGNSTQVTNSYKKVTGVNRSQTATGKFDTKGFNTRATVSYLAFNSNNLVVTPYVGVSYGAQYDGAYNETGTGVHNMFIAAKSTSELVAIAGAKVSSTFLVGDAALMPFATASMENVIMAKNHKLKARYKWADESATEVTDLGKSATSAYNLGLGLTAKHKNIEVSTEYNYRLKKKYNSHQGALKFKLLF